MKLFTSHRQQIGELGESIACKWLSLHGFSILERNWSSTSGEIDIISHRAGQIHFCEVKTTQSLLYNAGENITFHKKEKIIKTIHDYFLTHPRKPYQIDAILIYLERDSASAKVQYIEHINVK